VRAAPALVTRIFREAADDRDGLVFGQRQGCMVVFQENGTLAGHSPGPGIMSHRIERCVFFQAVQLGIDQVEHATGHAVDIGFCQAAVAHSGDDFAVVHATR